MLGLGAMLAGEPTGARNERPRDGPGFIAEALPAFVSEAHEQLEQLEQLLLELEDAPGDRELLDALFRCAHTVKGSGGPLRPGGVVGFTHHVETLLDRLREGELALDAALGSPVAGLQGPDPRPRGPGVEPRRRRRPH